MKKVPPNGMIKLRSDATKVIKKKKAMPHHVRVKEGEGPKTTFVARDH